MPSYCFLEAIEISKRRVYLKNISADFRLCNFSPSIIKYQI